MVNLSELSERVRENRVLLLGCPFAPILVVGFGYLVNRLSVGLMDNARVGEFIRNILEVLY